MKNKKNKKLKQYLRTLRNQQKTSNLFAKMIKYFLFLCLLGIANAQDYPSTYSGGGAVAGLVIGIIISIIYFVIFIMTIVKIWKTHKMTTQIHRRVVIQPMGMNFNTPNA